MGGGDMPSEWITAKHAARLLGRSLSRAYLMLASGALEGRRVGPAWRVALAGVRRLRDAQGEGRPRND